VAATAAVMSSYQAPGSEAPNGTRVGTVALVSFCLVGLLAFVGLMTVKRVRI
jgi:hypothetical protein